MLVMLRDDSDRIIPLDTYTVVQVDEDWTPSGSCDDIWHAIRVGKARIVKTIQDGNVVWKAGDKRA